MAKEQSARNRGRYGRWVLGGFLSSGLFLIMGLGQTVLAQPAQVLITSVFVDDPLVGQLRIVGQDFDNGPDLTVTLGEFPDLVFVGDPTATQIIAELPAGIAEGDYLLDVTTGNGGARNDVYNLTVGPEPPVALPANAIILWDTDNTCPAGFARVAAFDDRFLVGSATAATLGGADNHTHSAGSFSGPSHRHNLETWDRIFAPVDDNSGGTDFNARTDEVSGGTMTGTSGSTDGRPAFRTVLLCRRN